MNSPVKFRRALPVEFLRNVAWSVHGHFKDDADRAMTIKISSITEMVNRPLECTSIVIHDEEVQRALLELQAMDKLRFKWKTDDVILVFSQPYLDVDSETWHNAFDGLFGLYSNPPSLYYLQSQLNSLSDNPRRTTLEQLGRKYRGSTKTALTILRALQMMQVLHLSDDGAYISITDIHRDRCNETVYRETFYGSNN